MKPLERCLEKCKPVTKCCDKSDGKVNCQRRRRGTCCPRRSKELHGAKYLREEEMREMAHKQLWACGWELSVVLTAETGPAHAPPSPHQGPPRPQLRSRAHSAPSLTPLPSLSRVHVTFLAVPAVESTWALACVGVVVGITGASIKARV